LRGEGGRKGRQGIGRMGMVVTGRVPPPPLNGLIPFHATFPPIHPFLQPTGFPSSYSSGRSTNTPFPVTCPAGNSSMTQLLPGGTRSITSAGAVSSCSSHHQPPTWGFSNINTAGAKQEVASFLNKLFSQLPLTEPSAAPLNLRNFQVSSGLPGGP
jgi:hypothetical protein